MPVPVPTLGTPGNALSVASVPKGATVCCFVDLKGTWEGQLVCEMWTGATPPTAGTVFSAYKSYGNSTPNKLAGAPAANATTISVQSSTGLHQGQQIAVVAAATSVGEVVKISGPVTGTSLTITGTGSTGGLLNSYLINDLVYPICQTATSPTVQPASPTGTWAANSDYSLPMTLGVGQWVVAAANTDATATVGVAVSKDTVDNYTGS